MDGERLGLRDGLIEGESEGDSEAEPVARLNVFHRMSGEAVSSVKV